MLASKQGDYYNTERLPATLVSGLIVGAAARGLKFSNVLTHIVVFAMGTLIGWLFGS